MAFICGNLKIKRYALILLCLITVLIGILSGCADNSNQQSTTSGMPYFPVSTEKSGMEALATGTLILEDGYLRLSKSYSDDTSLIIWPVGYSLEKENDEVRILDEDGNVVARVGDNISAGGGEVGKGIVEKYIGEHLPGDCIGPFWLSNVIWINENSGQPSTTQSATSETSYFPVSTGEYKSYPDALATGTLILEDGYLRISPTYSDDTFLVIWPVGYSLEKENDEVRILDEDGNVVARVGDNISAGGGEVGKGIVEKYIGKHLPGDCEGPYWLSNVIWINEN